jgi:hypothetical protein
MAVVNTSTVGARGISGPNVADTLVEGVAVTARSGILLRSSTLRDASIVATSEGLRFTAPTGVLFVRDSRLHAVAATAVGVDVDPADPATSTLFFDHSAADTFGGTAYGYQTSGGTSRIGSSMVDGVTDDYTEEHIEDGRCIDTYDGAYGNPVSC